MKKRIFALVLALLCLCGCGHNVSPSRIELSFADTLMNAGAFEGSEMAPVDLQVAAILLGIDPDAIEEGVYYMAVNTSASADELLIVTMKNEEAALAVKDACQARVAAQIKVCESYCPAAVPRLEQARITRIGNSILYAVGDPDIVHKYGFQ